MNSDDDFDLTTSLSEKDPLGWMWACEGRSAICELHIDEDYMNKTAGLIRLCQVCELLSKKLRKKA